MIPRKPICDIVAVVCIISHLALTSVAIKPPNIIIQPERVNYFKKGENLELPCTSEGSPTPTYTWKKNEELIYLNDSFYVDRVIQVSGVGDLVFHNPIEADSGLYQCFASNKYGKSVSIKSQLQLAKLQPFPTVVKAQIKEPIVGEPMILYCTPPEGSPKPHIYWTILDSDNSDSSDALFAVKTNNRIALDFQGNLYFANVKEEDEQEGNRYICTAQSVVLRSINQGEDKIIKPQILEGEAPIRLANLVWHSESKIKGLKGDNVKMKCIFSGYPTPNVSWRKAVDQLIDGANELEYVIKNVQYEDEGNYECVGKNLEGEAEQTHTFQLTVESRPSWITEPQHVEAGVEESATFLCQAKGKPEVNVAWYINGVPFDGAQPDGHYTFFGGNLTYVNLTEMDNRVIQCNASNINGYIWADVYLHVLAIPPSFTEKPPAKLKVAETTNVTLTCRAYGKPKPVIAWFKGEQLVTGAHYKLMKNGDLFIRNVTDADSGSYKCHAKNRFGSNSTIGELQVRKATKIEYAPNNKRVKSGSDVHFSCSALTDYRELENLKILFFKDGVLVDISNPNIFQDESTNDGLKIIKLSSKDSGNYTCLATNGLDNATATAQLIVEGPPDPPVMLKVICNHKKAKITWMEGKDNFSPILHYIVEFKTSFDSTWHFGNKTRHKIEKMKLHLSPWANYTFRVKAENALGIGEASEPSFNICRTDSAVPATHPRNVETNTSKKKHLVIVWDAMPPLEHNGPGFRYVVRVKKVGEDTVEQYAVNGDEEARKEIEVEGAFIPYTVSVRAKNYLGEAPVPVQEVTGYSGEDVPSVAPENFESDPDYNMTADYAGFRWDPVSESPEQIQGVFKGYRIYYWKLDTPETLQKIDIPKTSHNSQNKREVRKFRTVVHLPPFSELNLTVVARNTYYDGPQSNSIFVKTPEGTPGKVRFLTALVRGSNHFVLKWNEPLQKNGIITGYDIAYQKISGLELGEVHDRVPQINNPASREALLKGLVDSQDYRIHIWARTNAGRGKGYFIDVRTEHPGSPDLPLWEVYNVGNGYLNVSWKMDHTKAKLHAGLAHFVEYRKRGETEWNKTPEQFTIQWQNISNLTPGITYEVRIVAKSGIYGSTSTTKIVPIPHTGAAAKDFTTATWFIGMMVAIAILILVLIIVCIIKRNREAKYHVQEEERLRGHDQYGQEDHFNEGIKNDENGIGKTVGSLNNSTEKAPGPETSDSDSLGEYGDVDPAKFNEDGSFIGQYGEQKREPSETAAPSAMSTFV